MTPLDDLLRALARGLDGRPDLPATLTDAGAEALFFTLVHDRRCPRCGADAELHGRLIRCAAHHRTGLTATTPLARTRVSLRHWLLGLWHVHVSGEAISACAFARRYTLRRPTAWRMLHRLRDALVVGTARTAGATTQLLGRCQPANTAFVTLSLDDGGLVAVPAEDAPPVDAVPPPLCAVWLGRLRAWMHEIFRAFRVRNLRRYLAEFAHGYGRVAWRGST